MRVALISTGFPPQETDGIARQRSLLASELTRSGHEVVVFTLGSQNQWKRSNSFDVCTVVAPRGSQTGSTDVYLFQSLSLYHAIKDASDRKKFDLIDAPLWDVPGIVPLLNPIAPVVLFITTTLADVLDVYGRDPNFAEKRLLFLEQLCLEKANGLMVDSSTIKESILQHYKINPSLPISVVPLGIEVRFYKKSASEGSAINALFVGRLEKRKGIQDLLKILPTLLEKYSNFYIRLVGKDNSMSDGWHQKYGQTYAEYFRDQHPQWTDRVVFEGKIDDAQLEAYYAQADLLLAPSLFESFGLVYLEGMRAHLPVVAFDNGAAREIFSLGENHGGVLVKTGDEQALCASICTLIEDFRLRKKIGEAGRAHFLDHYTSKRMAERACEFYQKILEKTVSTSLNCHEVVQVMEALDTGDGVSNIARQNARLLEEMGYSNKIAAKYWSPDLSSEVAPIEAASKNLDKALIFHYWGYNTSTWVTNITKGRKAFYYHNITPIEFFREDSPTRKSLEKGFRQLEHILSRFDLLIGDSKFNLQSLSKYLREPKFGICIYPIFDIEVIQATPYNFGLYEALKNSRDKHFIFTGRIARNKNQDRLIRAFAYYYNEINQYAHLWLVGNTSYDALYFQELQTICQDLPCRERVHFTGKVPDQDLYAYMRAADLFLSASEHEGFGMPLIEASSLKVPVIAYAAGAVPETLGGTGILLNEWRDEQVAELMHIVESDENIKNEVIRGQLAGLDRFNKQEMTRRLKAAVSFLLSGENSELFEWIYPQNKLVNT